MKKVLIRIELAVMRFILKWYMKVKRMFVKPLELKGMTVEQLLDSKAFRKELDIQIQMEQKHHTEMSYKAVEAGLRLQRAPIQRLMVSFMRGRYDLLFIDLIGSLCGFYIPYL